MTQSRPRQTDRSGISSSTARQSSSPPAGSSAGPSRVDPTLVAIIVDGDAQALVEKAEGLGRELSKPLSTSQIRSLFTEVRQIEAEWQHNPERAHRRLILLKPKMAYRVGKERRNSREREAIEHLVGVLTPAVDLVQGKEEHFQRFVEFFEAILAYHKAYGGR